MHFVYKQSKKITDLSWYYLWYSWNHSKQQSTKWSLATRVEWFGQSEVKSHCWCDLFICFYVQHNQGQKLSTCEYVLPLENSTPPHIVCELSAFTSSRLNFTASQQTNLYYTSVFMKFILCRSINSGCPSTHTASSCLTPPWPETALLL